jgi:hypothetical protein
MPSSSWASASRAPTWSVATSAGTRQRLPFYQEIEFFAPQQYRGLNQVELTFVADDREMDVILEMDKKPGLFSEGSDSFSSFQVGLNDFQGTDWSAYLNQWLVRGRWPVAIGSRLDSARQDSRFGGSDVTEAKRAPLPHDFHPQVPSFTVVSDDVSARGGAEGRPGPCRREHLAAAAVGRLPGGDQELRRDVLRS